MRWALKHYVTEVHDLFSRHEYRKVILSNRSHRHLHLGFWNALGGWTDAELPGAKQPDSLALL